MADIISEEDVLRILRSKLSIEIEVDNEPVSGNVREVTARLMCGDQCISSDKETIELHEFLTEEDG